MLSSEILPKYACITSTILCRNSNTMAALTFCLVTAATQMFDRFIWKKLVRAMLVTGERTCWRACITLTRNASTALRLKDLFVNFINYTSDHDQMMTGSIFCILNILQPIQTYTHTHTHYIYYIHTYPNKKYNRGVSITTKYLKY